MVYSIGKAGSLIFAGNGLFKTVGKVSGSGAVPVRPDGFVAWKSSVMDTLSFKMLKEVPAQVLSLDINVKKIKARH